MREKLPYLAAKFSFGGLAAYEIRSLIEALMHEGEWNDDFLKALDSSPPQLSEMLPAFLKIFENHGIAIPDKETAVWQLINYYVADIALKKVDPLEGVKRLIDDVCWNYDFDHQTKQFLGDSHNIEMLLGLYWNYEDLLDNYPPSDRESKLPKHILLEIKTAITQEAVTWLKKYELKFNSASQSEDARQQNIKP